MKREPYKELLRPLHIELVKMQHWAASEGVRLLLLFEGRDAAGKGGAIKTIIKHLNPRRYRVVALPKPTERERSQWCFQRYVKHLPAGGEIVLFDRSWYNRAGVERVMEFCSPQQVQAFFEATPGFESMLTDDGIQLRKFWFSITKEEQTRRIEKRRNNPLKQWKLTELDLVAGSKWDAYTQARDDTFARTATTDAPWLLVDANDKRCARLAVIRSLLRSLDYSGKDESLLNDAQGLVRRIDGV